MLDSLYLGKAAVVAAVLTLHHGLMSRVRLAEFEVVLTAVDTARAGVAVAVRCI